MSLPELICTGIAIGWGVGLIPLLVVLALYFLTKEDHHA